MYFFWIDKNSYFCVDFVKVGVWNLCLYKYSIIDSKIVITGSYNYTRKAKEQFENILISMNELQIVEKFEVEFNEMVEVCLKEKAAKEEQDKLSLLKNTENLKINQEYALGNILAHLEKENIKLLLNYGECYVNENQQLYQLLFDTANEADNDTPVYKEVLQLYQTAISKNITVDMEYLYLNGSTEVQLVVKSINETHKISKGWIETHNFQMPQEFDTSLASISKNILRIKYKIVQLEINKMIEENAEKINEGDSSFFQEFEQLLKIKNNLAKKLNIVIDSWTVKNL